jgi:hypothetical protein
MSPLAGKKNCKRSTIAYRLILEMKVGLSPTDHDNSSAHHSTSTRSNALRFARET